jgi:predicted lipid carrier protein YhbT
MPPAIPFALVAPLRLPLAVLPDALQARVLARLANHLLRGQHLARRLPTLDGKSVEIHITDADAHLRFGIEAGRLVASSAPRCDVVIRGALAEFWQLATRAEDPDTLFFHRRLSIEGDTETGLHVKNLLDALDYDLEAHVRAVLQETPARLLAPLLTPLLAVLRARR